MANVGYISEVVDMSGNVADIHAKRFNGDRNIQLTGAVTRTDYVEWFGFFGTCYNHS